MNEPDTSWPLAVVDAVLAHRLAEALREAAVDLAFHDHRIDHGADVVDRPDSR